MEQRVVRCGDPVHRDEPLLQECGVSTAVPVAPPQQHRRTVSCPSVHPAHTSQYCIPNPSMCSATYMGCLTHAPPHDMTSTPHRSVSQSTAYVDAAAPQHPSTAHILHGDTSSPQSTARHENARALPRDKQILGWAAWLLAAA
jgi:hypothetical protein